MKPLAIDLYCGLGGWAEGFLSEGYDVVGFDIERHRYPKRAVDLSAECTKLMCGKDKHGNTLMNRAHEQIYGFHRAPLTGEWEEYPGQLVLQDVLTLHGSQFKDAAVIVASPPCQAYSYRAMPWKRAKALPPPSNELFDACFRIQREASEAAGRHIPMVVENVKGAQPWVGRAKWHYGSYYLWGDVPALMPITLCDRKSTVGSWDRTRANYTPDHSWKTAEVKNNGNGTWFAIGSPGQKQTMGNPVNGVKVPSISGRRTAPGNGVRFTSLDCGADKDRGVKVPLSGRAWYTEGLGSVKTRCQARKAASAMIAKIPFPLAQHIARVYKGSI